MSTNNKTFEDLRKKKALVLCGTSGIGAAISSRFSNSVGTVYIASRTYSSYQKFTAMEGVNINKCVWIQLDIESSMCTETLTEIIPDPDILIYIPVRKPNSKFENIHHNQLTKAIENNLNILPYFKKCVSHMRKNMYGRIVLISGMSSIAPLSDHVLANVSRATIISLFNGLVGDYARFNITINTILLGPTNTEGLRKLWKERSKNMNITYSVYKKDIISKYTTKKLCDPYEVAEFCNFLINPEIQSLTGQIIRFDGGTNRISLS